MGDRNLTLKFYFPAVRGLLGATGSNHTEQLPEGNLDFHLKYLDKCPRLLAAFGVSEINAPQG